jgi:hypothetical protein
VFLSPARIEAGVSARSVPKVEALGHGLDRDQSGMDGEVRGGHDSELEASVFPVDNGCALLAPNRWKSVYPHG